MNATPYRTPARKQPEPQPARLDLWPAFLVVAAVAIGAAWRTPGSMVWVLVLVSLGALLVANLTRD